MTHIPVGIYDIGVYVPRLYITAEEFAEGRKRDAIENDNPTDAPDMNPGYIKRGLGIERMAVADANQDAAVMAAMAVRDVMEKNSLDPGEIHFIHGGTETAVDEAKSIVPYVVGMLEQFYGEDSFEHIGSPETKSACIAATYALTDRLAFIEAGWNDTEYAIVVGTDIAKYVLDKPEQTTCGAAAVAFLLSEDQRLLAFEPESLSYCTKDDPDFWRPIGHDTAFVEGDLSVACYLRDMRIAFDASKEKMLKSGRIKLLPGECITDHIDKFAYHTPFPKMVEWGFASVLIHDWRGLPRWDKIVDQIGPEPDRGELKDLDFYMSGPYKDYRSKFRKTEEFRDEYESKVKDSFEVLKLTANSYTAAWGLGTISHFESAKEDLAGKRFGVGSYGSGSSGGILSFIVQPEYQEVAKKLNLLDMLEKRQAISYDFYKQLHQKSIDPQRPVLAPKNEFVLDHIGSEEGNYGYRYYKLV